MNNTPETKEAKVTEDRKSEPAQQTAALQKLADEVAATGPLSVAVSDSITAKTAAAIADIHSVAMDALKRVKLRATQLEAALEQKRQQSLAEITSFVAAATETMNATEVLGRALDNLADKIDRQ